MQVFDIPPAALTVTEYQMMASTCGCGQVTTALPPPGVTGGPVCYGPNVVAAATLLASTDVIGIERAADLMGALFKAPVSTGFVSRCLVRLDAALTAAGFEDALKDALRAAEVLGTDETPAPLATGAVAGITAAPFSPHGVSLAVLALGVTAVFGQFSGFEGAATLGEEARRSTRVIPAAIAWSLTGSAAVYIFFTWIVYTAYPGPAAIAASPAPLVHVAGVYLGSGALGSGAGLAVNAAGLVSAFGAQLACLTAAARLAFALGRETSGGRAGAFLTRTWPRYASPAGALTVTGAASVAALLGFGFEHTATRAATLIIRYGAYLILAAYLMTVIAALAWTWRTRRRPLPLAILTTGAAVLGYVLYRTFAPFPAAPFGWVALAAAASLLAEAATLPTPGLKAPGPHPGTGHRHGRAHDDRDGPEFATRHRSLSI